MIGVDIIDLSQSFSRSKYSLGDYQNKILQKSELAFCQSIIDLECIWAIKESAYKCHYKNTGVSFYNPKRILITQLDLHQRRFFVQIDDLSYAGSFQIGEAYVFAICHPQINQRSLDLNTEERIFMGAESSDEFNKFFNHEADQARFLFHEDGFPQSISLGSKLFSYSRSQHGAFFISVICPVQYN
jgi:hypothetical protein